MELLPQLFSIFFQRYIKSAHLVSDCRCLRGLRIRPTVNVNDVIFEGKFKNLLGLKFLW